MWFLSYLFLLYQNTLNVCGSQQKYVDTCTVVPFDLFSFYLIFAKTQERRETWIENISYLDFWVPYLCLFWRDANTKFTHMVVWKNWRNQKMSSSKVWRIFALCPVWYWPLRTGCIIIYHEIFLYVFCLYMRLSGWIATPLITCSSDIPCTHYYDSDRNVNYELTEIRHT